MGFGDYKKKRTKIGRPKELESIMRKLDQALVSTMDRAQEDLPIAYQTIHDVLVAKDSSPTNKFSAAKWIIEYGEKSFAALQKAEEELAAMEAAGELPDDDDAEDESFTTKLDLNTIRENQRLN